MTGHATKKQDALVRELEASLDPSTSPVEQLLDLAVLYLCPHHEGVKAAALLEKILRREPDNGDARIWFAYAAAHELMDSNSLRRAYNLLTDELRSRGDRAGAAALLAAYVGKEAGIIDDKEEKRLLELSVQLEPRWVYNRQILAHRYASNGEVSKALGQLESAEENILDSTQHVSHREREFEVEITGRGAHRVRENLAELRRKLRGER